MNSQEDQKKSGRDLLLILLLLPLGVCLMFTAGQAAITLSPSWVLNADMGSGLDPNVEYEAMNNPELMEPILSGILTPPAWAGVFLTPGAVIPGAGEQSGVVPPPSQQDPVVPPVNPPSDAVPPVVVVPPPQPPNPPGPPNPPVSPPEPPTDVSVDLKVTKNDGQTSYSANSTVSYSIIVTNIGTNDVNGAVVKDNLPTQIASWDWICKSATKASGCSAVTGSASNFTDTVNIQSGGSIEYTVKADTKAGASGDLVNTASASVPSGYNDTNSSNDSATDTDKKTIILFSADLSITKNNGATNTYVPGSPISPYTITVTNNGPSLVIGAKVKDIFDTSILSNIKWTCVASSGAFCSANGSGNINDTVNLLKDASVTYTVTADAKSNATGGLDNTASVSLPVGVSDPDGSNNSDNDTDTAAPSANLSIDKDDGVTSYIPGESVTYTIKVTNAGPSDVTGATLTDNIPGQVQSWGWCVAPCAPVASGSSNLSATVSLTAGSSITYLLKATTKSSATTSLANTATISSPIDPDTSDNTKSDTDTAAPSADLSIDKDDGVTSYIPGGSVTYTIKVTNAGPSDVTNATLADNIPAQVQSWGWCVAPCAPVASGSSNLSATVSLTAGSSITYLLKATTKSSATTSLANTATISSPIDPDTSDNTKSDTDTAAPSADLSIDKDDGVTSYIPGGSVTYTIKVTNAGPSDVTGAALIDNIPGQVQSWGWCVAPCTPVASGNSNLSDTVDLTAGSSVTYLLKATTKSSATTSMTNTATISSPIDPDTSNNSESDTDMASPSADLVITKTDGSDTYAAGLGITYTIEVTNDGPNNASGFNITDNVPTAITGLTVDSCVVTGTASCGTNNTVGNAVSFTGASINAGAGNKITIQLSGTVASGTTGTLSNRVDIVIPSGASFSDPDTSNNFSIDSDTEGLPPPSNCTGKYIDVAGTGSVSIPDGEFRCLRFTDGTLSKGAAITATGHPGMTVWWYGTNENLLNGCSVRLHLYLNASTPLTDIGVARDGEIIIYVLNLIGNATMDITSITDWGGCP